MPQADRKFKFVYVTSHPKGYYYIGVHFTDNIDDGYLGSGKKLKQYFKKYPAPEWSRQIVAYFDTRDGAFAFEKSLVTAEELRKEHCLNLKLGGYGCSGWVMTDATREKHRENGKRNEKSINALKSYERTPEYRKSLSVATIEACARPEVKARRSELASLRKDTELASEMTRRSWQTRKERYANGFKSREN